MEFMSQFLCSEVSESNRIEEINRLCQKCLILKYFDDNFELYQKFCNACALELKSNEERSPQKVGIEDINAYDVNYSFDALNNTVTLPKLSVFVNKHQENMRKIRKEYQERYGRVINHYSNDFPNPVIPKEIDLKWKAIFNELFKDDLRNKIENWYFSTPASTMKDSFKPQPLHFLKDRIAHHKRK